jgi:hypothetical protein
MRAVLINNKNKHGNKIDDGVRIVLVPFLYIEGAIAHNTCFC